MMKNEIIPHQVTHQELLKVQSAISQRLAELETPISYSDIRIAEQTIDKQPYQPISRTGHYSKVDDFVVWGAILLILLSGMVIACGMLILANESAKSKSQPVQIYINGGKNEQN
jgi:hypothetical protein